MKNISIQIAVAIVSLVLVVASAFLMTAADAEIRVLANYLTLGWAIVFTVSATRALLLERTDEDNAEAVNDLSEDMRKELDNIYEAIAALSVKVPEASKQPRPIGFKQSK